MIYARVARVLAKVSRKQNTGISKHDINKQADKIMIANIALEGANRSQQYANASKTEETLETLETKTIRKQQKQ